MNPVQTRVYVGNTRSEAEAKFNADAKQAWNSGYQPVNQAWKGPNWLPAVVVPIAVGVILFIVLPVWWIALAFAVIVGVIYAIAARPRGQLTVTYVVRQ